MNNDTKNDTKNNEGLIKTAFHCVEVQLQNIYTHCAEGPATAATPLVLDSRDYTVLPPVKGL